MCSGKKEKEAAIANGENLEPYELKKKPNNTNKSTDKYPNKNSEKAQNSTSKLSSNSSSQINPDTLNSQSGGSKNSQQISPKKKRDTKQSQLSTEPEGKSDPNGETTSPRKRFSPRIPKQTGTPKANSGASLSERPPWNISVSVS